MPEHGATKSPESSRQHERLKPVPEIAGPAAEEAIGPDAALIGRMPVSAAPPAPRDIIPDGADGRRGVDRARATYVAQLQRTHGNRHVSRMLASTGVARPEASGAAPNDIVSSPAEPEGATVPAAASDERLSGAQPAVQRISLGGIWDSISDAASSAVSAVSDAASSAVSAVGGAISTAASAIGGAASAVGSWLVERARDVGMYLINAIRDLPGRLLRLGMTLVDGLIGVASFIPGAIAALINGGISGLGRWLGEQVLNGLAWAGTLVSRVFDVLGGPEVAEFVLHLLGSGTTPLTPPEINAAQRVLGAGAVRWNEVRVSEGFILEHVIFNINNRRAFTTAHTINMPRGGRDLETMVHELTHVYQYEQVGSLYIGQAIHAQATAGYDYGDRAGLQRRRAAGQGFRTLNREQQAQVAEDYFKNNLFGDSVYEPFINELRAGQL
jgi:hypothetical protein